MFYSRSKYRDFGCTLVKNSNSQFSSLCTYLLRNNNIFHCEVTPEITATIVVLDLFYNVSVMKEERWTSIMASHNI